MPAMNAPSAIPADGAPPAALAAFLRGIERRGLVLALCQCGDEDAGTRALAAAMRTFAGRAAPSPIADWPARFWHLLAASPLLRQPVAAGDWPRDLAALAAIAPLDRLALLLRLVAGLDEAAAARALDVDQDGYRAALARACPRDAQGRPDAGAWRSLAEALQARVRALPEVIVARLHALYRSEPAVPAATLAIPVPGGPRPATPARPPSPRRVRRAWRWPSWRPGRRLWLAVAAVLGVTGGALLWHRLGHHVTLPPDADGGWTPAIVTEPLPGTNADIAPVPAAPDAADTAMLADPDLALARDADFYAWVAAGEPVPAPETEPPPANAPAEGALETESADE